MICAGIVLYNPSIERLKKNIDRISTQVDEVILIDNHSKNIEEIIGLTNIYGNVFLQNNSENLGIAIALNQICEAARKRNSDWVLTLDQDTICPEKMIKKMSEHTDREDIGIICPQVDYGNGQHTRNKSNVEFEYPYACMTSGSLTRISAWKKIGGFREDFFIDFVDNDYCMRLGLNGFRILRLNSCVIQHELGETVERRFLGIKKIKYVKHSPLRLYYMSRNNLFFINQYRKNLNVPKEIAKVVYVILSGYFASDEKKKARQFIWRGIRDAKNGEMGKISV